MMSAEQRAIVASLAEPPVPKAARILWYQSKALELLSHFLFEPKDPEFFCMRQKRVARDRVMRTKELLGRDLAASIRTLYGLKGCRISVAGPAGDQQVRAASGVTDEAVAATIPLVADGREVGAITMDGSSLSAFFKLKK